MCTVKKNIIFFEKSLDFCKKIDYKSNSDKLTNQMFVNETTYSKGD